MPFLWIGLSYVAGILMGAYCGLASHVWLAILVVGGVSAPLERVLISRERHPLRIRKLFATLFSLLISACALGALRFSYALPDLSARDLAWHQPHKQAVVTGIITSYPQRSARATTAVVAAESIQTDGQVFPVSGRLEIRLPAGFDLRYGNRLRLSGYLQAVVKDGQPAYSSHLARQGVFSRMAYPRIQTLGWGYGIPLMAGIYRLRQHSQRLIYEQMPYPESSLLEGILLGIEWNIPAYLISAYRASGLIHIIAISGFNIALITHMVILLFRHLFPLKWAGGLAAAAILGYTLMVGAEPAVVRAAIMGCTAIPAHAIGRRQVGLHALTMAGAVMTMFNPFLLWDISFQLSFLATLGLMLMADPLTNALKNGLARILPEAHAAPFTPLIYLLAATMAAQFAVSPVLLEMDTQLPVFSLAANLIMLPVQPLVMILGGLSVLSGLVVPGLGALLGMLTWPLILLSNRAALYFSMHPFARLSVPAWGVSAASVMVAISMVFFATRQLRSLTRPTSQTKNVF